MLLNLLQEFTANALPGDSFLPRSQFRSWNAQAVNDNTIFPQLATLWGDNFSPYAQFRSWYAKSSNDNPTFARAATLWGDSYVPWSRLDSWRATQSFWSGNEFVPSALLIAGIRARRNLFWGSSWTTEGAPGDTNVLITEAGETLTTETGDPLKPES